MAAALIHDGGLLVLASRAPDYLAEALERAAREERPLFEGLDLDHLERIGVAARVPGWRAIAATEVAGQPR